MTHHLEYEKNQSRPGANSRNGYSTKTVITGDGPLELRTPRDRDGTFEPQLVKKNQTRITGMDSQILSLYAKGMTAREIAAAFKELYDADVSPALISKVTDAVMEQVVEWQNRPLDAVYPIVYLDCIVLKVRQDSRVINKSVFLALGINIEGQKELRKRAARTVLTGMCYSVGSATRQGSSSPTRFIGQSAMTSRT
ncbi:transposase, Mutator family protein [Escherichia coli 3-020-07_S3_C2]|nr:transposase, Mutator family protein [Escherichia coli 3-020-07_S3_C2]